ncbi:hypothetical protein O3P69_018274 [Scylla paramamosain]|uniref:Uncharacterized protein n=1 Tax=Scylla paramamosain TaxID=85552 RepID=A0AAW0TIW4_SCYPA
MNWQLEPQPAGLTHRPTSVTNTDSVLSNLLTEGTTLRHSSVVFCIAIGVSSVNEELEASYDSSCDLKKTYREAPC